MYLKVNDMRYRSTKKSLNDQTLKKYIYVAKHGNYLRSAEITLPFKLLIHSLIPQICDGWGQDV